MLTRVAVAALLFLASACPVLAILSDLPCEGAVATIVLAACAAFLIWSQRDFHRAHYRQPGQSLAQAPLRGRRAV